MHMYVSIVLSKLLTQRIVYRDLRSSFVIYTCTLRSKFDSMSEDHVWIFWPISRICQDRGGGGTHFSPLFKKISERDRGIIMAMTDRWADKQKKQKNNENHRGKGGNCHPPPPATPPGAATEFTYIRCNDSRRVWRYRRFLQHCNPSDPYILVEGGRAYSYVHRYMTSTCCVVCTHYTVYVYSTSIQHVPYVNYTSTAVKIWHRPSHPHNTNPIVWKWTRPFSNWDTL